METLCFSCKNAYAHKCGWIELGSLCKECEERKKLLEELGLKYMVIERAEGRRYIILSCKNYNKDMGGSLNE